jgi:hypothetical protein
MTKLADAPPAYCSSCFGRPDGRYVDFEAAYDGPVVPGTPTPVPVDDLILCESCLREAFRLLDPDDLKATIRELEEVVQEQDEALNAKDRTIQGAKATITELVEHPVAPAKGKPALIGVSDEVRKMITKRRLARAEHARKVKAGAEKAKKEKAAA